MKEICCFIVKHMLSDLTARVKLVRSSVDLTKYTIAETENGAVFTFEPVEGLDLFEITARYGAKGVVFSINAKATIRNGYICGFAPENAIEMTLGDMKPDALLGSHHDGPWWMYPKFTKDFAELRPQTQSLLVKSGDMNYHILPLTGDNFRCDIDAGKLIFSSDMSGLCSLSGDFLAVAASEDPVGVFEDNYKNAHALGAIRVPLRGERTLPEFFRGFGWCTWDAFYHDVSSAKIYEKLDEFKAKGIPVKWVIIDDGWLTGRGRKLADFNVDLDKFPEGFKATITKMKQEYGVEKVGVWHAFQGYWDGVDPESYLYRQQKDNLFTTPSGLVIQSLDEDRAFRFWDEWHSFLADCGVDFLKVDNQSSASSRLHGAISTAEGCRIAHRALERSIDKNFGGAVINCMGMDMENVFARPHSAVSRNSDDFFPKRENGFVKHLVQNTYNSLWHSRMYHCDFDMWWSDHESAYQSGVLRAISGSPIYVSDPIGKSLRETILPVIENDGTIMLCDYAALPTTERVYLDCVVEHRFQTLWNRSDESFALAAFNVSQDDVTDTVSFGGIPELSRDRDYIAYEYFTRKFTRITADTQMSLTLPKNGVAVWSIYPVLEESGEEYILLGDTSKYVPIASAHKTRKAVSELSL